LAAPGGHALTAARWYLIDSTPIPLCAPLRHGRVRWLRDEGASCGNTSTGWFFGFTLPLLRPSSGWVLTIIVTPGNGDERDPALALRQPVGGGATLGELGSRGPACANTLAEAAALVLLTRDHAPEHTFVRSQGRHGSEPTVSPLWGQVVARVFRRSWRGWWDTLPLRGWFDTPVPARIVTACDHPKTGVDSVR